MLTLSLPVHIFLYKVKDHITSLCSYGTLSDRDSYVTDKLQTIHNFTLKHQQQPAPIYVSLLSKFLNAPGDGQTQTQNDPPQCHRSNVPWLQVVWTHVYIATWSTSMMPLMMPQALTK